MPRILRIIRPRPAPAVQHSAALQDRTAALIAATAQALANR